MLNLSLPPAFDALKNEKCFVAWTLEQRNGKTTKVPYSPVTGNRAASNDSGTWGTLQAAVEAAETNGYAGVGIMLGNGLVGVDLDHVLTDGDLNPEAARIVEQLASYTEISPSGTGLHIFCWADDVYSQGRRGSSVFAEAADAAGADLEFYAGGRYFTLTGNVYGDARPIENRTKEIAALHAHYWPKPETRDIVPRTRTAPRSDSDALDKMLQCNPNAAALYAGDMSAYDNDHSRADMALCMHLAFWTDGDAAQADRLFRSSGLMRDKWDEKHFANGDTYGERTLSEACRRYAETAAGFRQMGRLFSSDDVVQAYEGTAQAGSVLYLPRIERTQAAYLSEGAYTSDIASLARHRNDRTGFAAIDRAHPFYPGLYVLGAASSLGKTSFALQLADQVAETGRDVLYISLEQTAAELTAKSIARYAARLAKDPNEENPFYTRPDDALSAAALRTGAQTLLTERAADLYRDTAAGRVHIVQGSFRTRAADVIHRVREWLGQHGGATPLVIVDYLQALAPSADRQTEKQVIDDALGELKDFQGANELTLLLISSLNRANYLVPVSFESFKESGGIEYTADVVWGLDLACLQDELFDTNGHLIEKREVVKRARRDTPREIILQCLKNRFGVSSYSAGFYFDPVHDTFTETLMIESGDPVFGDRPGTYREYLQEVKDRLKLNKTEAVKTRAAVETLRTQRAMHTENERTTREALRSARSIRDPEERASVIKQLVQDTQAAYDAAMQDAMDAARDAEPYTGDMPF